MHPRRRHIHENRTLGERIADSMAQAVGSWGFVIGQTIFIAAWIVYNSLGKPFDPFPWILLNLCMSTQAMYTGPILLLATNRQASKDRMRDDTEAQEVELLYQINQQQLAILSELRQQRRGEAASSGRRPARDPKTGRYVKASARVAEGE